MDGAAVVGAAVVGGAVVGGAVVGAAEMGRSVYGAAVGADSSKAEVAETTGSDIEDCWALEDLRILDCLISCEGGIAARAADGKSDYRRILD